MPPLGFCYVAPSHNMEAYFFMANGKLFWFLPISDLYILFKSDPLIISRLAKIISLSISLKSIGKGPNQILTFAI